MIRWTERMDGLGGRQRAAVALAAGAVAALALPPLNFWPALFVGFPLFLAMLGRQPMRSWRSGFGLGWLFGFGYFGIAFHWIGFAFLVDAATYLWMMPFMLGALAGGMAIYWGLAAMVARRLGGTGPGLTFALASSIGLAEWLRGHLLTGFPWAAPGLAVDGMGALAQAASVTGMTGLTVLLVLWAGLPSVFLERSSRPARTVAVIVLIALPAAWAAGTWRLSSATDGVVPGVSIRIVQPNIGQEQKWREDNARAIFDLLKNLSMAPTPQRPDGIGGVTHVIWPESAVPFLIDESAGAKAELRPMLGGRTVLITGALRRAPGDGPDRNVYNSIITFNGEAEVAARYDKWRLVPGGEFLPFESVLEPLGFRKVVTVPGSFAAGPGAVTVTVPGLPGAALLVCYEAIFPHGLIDPRHRPGVLVNVTNDGWFGRSTGPYQHLAQARLRAIEQGLPLLRAANTGISVVIDSYGRELSRLPLMQQGVIDAALPVALASTYYATFGDAAMLVLVLLSAALSLTLRKAMPSDASGQLRSS